MIVKVQCPCGARFEFEVQPRNGRMPVGLNCPSCGNNATDLANAVIAQQLGTAAPPVAEVPVAVPVAPVVNSPPVGTPPAPTSGLRIAKTHAPSPHLPTTAVPVAVPISQQMSAAEKRAMIAENARKKREADERYYGMFREVALVAIVIGVLLFGVWQYYEWFGRKPKIVYSLDIPVPQIGSVHALKPDEYYQLIGPGQLLSVKNKHASLYDITKQTSLWNVSLQTDAEAAAAKAAQDKKNAASSDKDTGFRSEEDYNLSNPQAAVTTNDIWLGFADRLMRLDRQTGARKEPLIMGRILDFSSDAEALMLVYITPDDQRTLARISLADGAIQTTNVYGHTDQLKPTTQILARNNLVNTNLPKLPTVSNDAMADKARADGASIVRKLQSEFQPNGSRIAPSRAPKIMIDEMASYAFNHEETPPFILAGPNVVQFSTQLLEEKTITHESIKPKGKSILDDGNVTASQGLDLAQEMINDSARQRGGGVVTEDVSRYQVTLHRWFADDAPDWTGEVVGPPSIYSAKTVDLLVAGQTLTVFNKHNKKLWEGKLTYPSRPLQTPPFLETKDALYFADAGVLTRFDLDTGNVRWRLDSVGIASLQMDSRGNLYIASTTAGPDHIAHPDQVNLHEKIHPLILKVDSDTGKIVWRLESVGTDCLLSGKFLYSTRTAHVQSALKLEEGPDMHYDLRLLNPRNGNNIWEYHTVNRPVYKTEIQGNWIMLRFEDGVTVLKFFSL